jgi:hypothetical protein
MGRETLNKLQTKISVKQSKQAWPGLRLWNWLHYNIDEILYSPDNSQTCKINPHHQTRGMVWCELVWCTEAYQSYKFVSTRDRSRLRWAAVFVCDAGHRGVVKCDICVLWCHACRGIVLQMVWRALWCAVEPVTGKLWNTLWI